VKQAQLFLLLSALSATSFGLSGTYTTYATTWNNLSRQYAVYVPASLPANPSMVLFLHGH
jgi:poly(3-hydroxybutyrate) depolymerase